MSSVTLARRALGAGSLWIFGVGASSPLTVLVRGVIETYATTGVVGVPASFVLLTVAFALLAVAYLAMSRRVVRAAPFYAVLARGIGGRVAAAGATVALLGYNCIQITLFGLVGVTVAVSGPRGVVGMGGGRVGMGGAARGHACEHECEGPLPRQSRPATPVGHVSV
jgi:hypothetical protein